MRRPTYTFDEYWDRSTSKHDVNEYIKTLESGEDFTRPSSMIKRMLINLAERAWTASAKAIRKDFDIVWTGNRWRIKGTIKESLRAKVRKALPRVASVIEVVHEPEFAGPEKFRSIFIGEVFEFESDYYKKLPYSLSQQTKSGKKLGLAISLLDEGVYHFLANDVVVACDVQCSISYVYARETSVLEEKIDEADTQTERTKPTS